MAYLGTLEGIAEARSALYNQLMDGTVSEQRANVADRLLRGQTTIKGDLPIKLLNMVTRMKTTSGKDVQDRLIDRVLINLGVNVLPRPREESGS